MPKFKIGEIAIALGGDTNKTTECEIKMIMSMRHFSSEQMYRIYVPHKPSRNKDGLWLARESHLRKIPKDDDEKFDTEASWNNIFRSCGYTPPLIDVEPLKENENATNDK